MQNIDEVNQIGPEPVIEDWVGESRVKSAVPFVNMPRSEALETLDLAVADLARVYRDDARAALETAQVVLRRLRAWRATKAPDHDSIREPAIDRLEAALRRIFARYYGARVEAVRNLPSSTTDPTRVWLHGTDAVGEILATGDLWGGSAALKLHGSNEQERRDAVESSQEQHFFVVETQENGTTQTPGNAFVKARQGADAKMRSNEPLRSWERAGRPMIGVIEFNNHDNDQIRTLGTVRSGPGADEIRAIPTGTPNADYRSTIALQELDPVAIRVLNEADAVRILDYVLVNAESPERLQSLPPTIRVLTNAGSDPDLVALTGNPHTAESWRALLRENGHTTRLVTEAQSWRTYDTVAVVNVLREFDVRRARKNSEPRSESIRL